MEQATGAAGKGSREAGDGGIGLRRANDIVQPCRRGVSKEHALGEIGPLCHRGDGTNTPLGRAGRESLICAHRTVPKAAVRDLYVGPRVHWNVETSPTAIDLKKDRGLTVQWADGAMSYYTIAYLRKMSPSAEARELRDQQKKNPLAILPSSAVSSGAIAATGAELVGNYALRISFNDGHNTGIYSWQYLREIDPALSSERSLAEGTGGGAGVTGGKGGTGGVAGSGHAAAGESGPRG